MQRFISIENCSQYTESEHTYCAIPFWEKKKCVCVSSTCVFFKIA